MESEFDSPCLATGLCDESQTPMHLKQIDSDNELMQVFKRASARLADRHTVFRKATATIRDGRRHQAFDAYLKPALNRPNLHVMLKTQAISVRFEKKVAESVYILEDHKYLNNIFADKEIILSAGAIKTPQILMLSGIGPKDLLRRLKIAPISENPHVGRNFHDHMNVPLYVSIKKPLSITLSKVFTLTTAWDYFWNGQGLLSFPPVAGVEYKNTSALMLFSMGSTSERLLRELSNYRPQVFRDIFPFHNDSHKEGFVFLATCVQPRSRGSVTVNDVSTTVPVAQFVVRSACSARSRSERSERGCTGPGRNVACLCGDTPGRNSWLCRREGKRWTQPTITSAHHFFWSSSQSADYPVRSPPDEYLECVIRETAVTGHHASGTW
ncbi:unnamed protein product [Leptidea sinapis]|uniref:Glucose-methanol-choline oxidoreductase N-terminal domain-containing protein n=1 Tax=Leptidea sinapis TaxID=189913 RepID=A0A5E4QN74_9NEOP|nr:unnamed protein product [Leptidea sinapis]